MANWFKNHFYLFFFGIFAGVGTLMGIAAVIFWLQDIRLTNKGVYTQAVVVDMVENSKGGYAPVVEFELKNGRLHRYTSSLYSSPASYEIGERVDLWYNPDDPTDLAMAGLDRWFLPALFGGFFLVFGGIGYGGLIYQWLKKRDRAWLQQHGQAVEANFTGVYLKTNLKVNNASPFILQCQWVDPMTHITYDYESDPIWFDPSPYIKGPTLQVWIDPKDPAMYSVDLGFLPENQ